MISGLKTLTAIFQLFILAVCLVTVECVSKAKSSHYFFICFTQLLLVVRDLTLNYLTHGYEDLNVYF